MAAEKKKNTVQTVTGLAEPVAERLGLMLWDVRFEKEGASWFLRVFIDKEGGVTIDDCEAMSRALDGLLDEADPIEQSYYLEVSSPGIERLLVKDWHYRRYIGSEVTARLIRPQGGKRSFVGILTAAADDTVCLKLADGQEFSFDKKDIAFVRVYFKDFDGGRN